MCSISVRIQLRGLCSSNKPAKPHGRKKEPARFRRRPPNLPGAKFITLISAPLTNSLAATPVLGE